MAWGFCISGAAAIKAGVNASASLLANASALDNLSNQVEASINTITRRDWNTNPPTAKFSGALAELASNLIAMKIINYDMSGYTSRLEASTMLDVLKDGSTALWEALKDDKIKEIIV